MKYRFSLSCGPTETDITKSKPFEREFQTVTEACDSAVALAQMTLSTLRVLTKGQPKREAWIDAPGEWVAVVSIDGGAQITYENPEHTQNLGNIRVMVERVEQAKAKAATA